MRYIVLIVSIMVSCGPTATQQDAQPESPYAACVHVKCDGACGWKGGAHCDECIKQCAALKNDGGM